MITRLCLFSCWTAFTTYYLCYYARNLSNLVFSVHVNLNSLAYKFKFFQTLELMPLEEKQRKAVSRPRHQHFSYL